MAKEATRDRYRIHADTSLEEMGVVLAALTRMGLQNIGYELITDVRAFGHNKTHETSAEYEVTEYIKDHPTFTIADVVAHLKSQGRSAGAAYTAVRVMVQKKSLVKLSPGNYQRADVKAIAAPKPAKTAPGNGHARTVFSITGKDSIWRQIRNRKKFTSQELTVLFRAQGRNPNSVSPLLTAMVVAKQIKQTGVGEYVVLKKAVTVKGAKTKKAKSGASVAKQTTSPNPSLNGPAEADHHG
jgi:hypothetical protein